VLASFPLVTSGPLITEDANTVAHVYWNGTALVDTKGNAWTENGTVPQVSANPFTTTRYGAGPFSAANYYSLGTGTDVLDFAGDFTACFVYSSWSGGGDGVLFSNGAAFTPTTAGYAVLLGTGGTNALYYAYGVQVPDAGNVVPANGPSVTCIGQTGATGVLKTNLGTYRTKTTGSTAATGATALLGRYPGTAQPFLGTIYEAYFTTTAPSDALFTAIQQKVLGHYDGYSPLAVTRTTNATYAPRSAEPYTLFTAAPGVARITDQGLLVEPARTNYSLQSNTMSTGTAATSPWVLNNATVATVAGAPMGGTWAETTSTTNIGNFYQTITAASSTTFVGSVWMAKASGTGYAGLLVWCGAGTPSACACSRSDGGTCAASTAYTNFCKAEVADLGTTPVRLSAATTCSGAITATNLLMLPGRDGTATGTTRFSGAQLEVGTYPTSHIVTTSTATARNADQVSATVPAVAGDKFCLAGTFLPEEGMTWATVGSARTWMIGNATYGSAFMNMSLLGNYDATPALRQRAWTPPTSGAVRASFCTASALLDVKLSAGTAGVLSGTGTGLMGTSLTTLYIGQRSNGAEQFPGYLKNLKICKASKAKECR
jgi:hypothetical protein